VADVCTVEDALALVGELADLVDAPAARAHAIADEVRAGVDEARAIAGTHPPVPLFCPIWRDPWLTISPPTYMFDLLRLAGGEPGPRGRPDQRYPKVTLDAVRASSPAVVLLPDEPYSFAASDGAELAALLPTARIHFTDGKRLCWYGRRTAAVASLAALLARAA
jgi:hypothetical protein